MKIWLNDLVPGDIFYHDVYDKVYKCKHLGLSETTDLDYCTPRILYEVCDKDGAVQVYEAVVNQFVYDNEDEAYIALYDKLEYEYNQLKASIEESNAKITLFKKRQKQIEDILNGNERN